MNWDNRLFSRPDGFEEQGPVAAVDAVAFRLAALTFFGAPVDFLLLAIFVDGVAEAAVVTVAAIVETLSFEVDIFDLVTFASRRLIISRTRSSRIVLIALQMFAPLSVTMQHTFEVILNNFMTSSIFLEIVSNVWLPKKCK